MRKKWRKATGIMLLMTVTFLSMSACGKKEAGEETIKLTNVSYDPTRELYEEYNKVFEKQYQEKTGKKIKVIQSHGGSGGQARSVVEGSDADVVTLALEHDITLIERTGLIEAGWLKEFPKDSSPYTSTIIFLVRKGNPKKIYDWEDLIKKGIQVITPDPKSSGGACWNFLAAWNYAMKTYHNDETKAKEYVKALYENVIVMDSGARGATTTFVENGQGDVLLAWENEAINTMKQYPDEYEIINPKSSILAQPSVAIVDENANIYHTQDVAKEYLNGLYTDEAQRIIGKNGYRPTNPEILKEFADSFSLDIEMCSIKDFGGWDAAYKKFFDDGGVFDEIYNP